MPIETIIFVSAVIVAFTLLAITLAWAQRSTVSTK